MEFNMTDKDKRLLVFLAAFLTVVGFMVFLILPAVDRREELDTRILEETATKETMETVIASYPALEIQYDALREQEKTALKEYYPIMSSQEIDRKLTGILIDKQTEAMDLNITMGDTSGLQLKPYFASMLALMEGSTEENGDADASSDTTADSDSQESDSTLSSARVMMTTQGTEKQLRSILNTLFMKRPEIHINTYTLSRSREDSVTGEAANPVLTVDMNLYMCDKENDE